MRRALAGYRRLFRARQKLFQGDERALRESRVALRAEFEKNRVVTDAAHLEGLFVMIDEAEDMMLHGIVQGKLNDDGNYGELFCNWHFLRVFGIFFLWWLNPNVVAVKLGPEHAAGDNPEGNLEPINAETVSKFESGPKVEVTKSTKPT